MTLPSSGPLTLADIQTEFGGSNPISLSEYYAGGAYVPAGTSGTYGAVPSSGAISIRNFYGTSNVVISITDQYISGSGVSDAYAFYFLTAGGQVEQSTDAGGINPTNLEQWCTPTAQSSNYEALVTLVFGTLSGGTVGSYVALSTTRSWYVEEFTPGGSNFCEFTVQIRKIGTSTVLDTATITLEANVF
jgi:hypothetical protein